MGKVQRKQILRHTRRDGSHEIEHYLIEMKTTEDIVAEIEMLEAIVASMPGQTPPFVQPMREWAQMCIANLEQQLINFDCA